MVDARLESGWELPPVSDEAKLATYLDAGNPANRQAVFDSLEEHRAAARHRRGPAGDAGHHDRGARRGAAGRKSVEEALAVAEERINAAIGG